MPDLTGTADVVVVGGGSAGAVLAARLSQDPARTVLLLEAGHAYASDAYPPALLDANKIADPDHDWGYTSRGTIQAPRVLAPRGKVLGGSSAVNATVALRTRAADFAKWGTHGAEGWSFDDVLPVFKLLENTPPGTTPTTGGPARCRSGSAYSYRQCSVPPAGCSPPSPSPTRPASTPTLPRPSSACT